MKKKQRISPTAGMGATLLWWSDRHAYTVVRVSESGKTFWMQRDKAKRTDSNGRSNCQSYSYTRLTTGSERRVKYSNAKKCWMSGGQKVILGSRDEYHDPDF